MSAMSFSPVDWLNNYLKENPFGIPTSGLTSGTWLLDLPFVRDLDKTERVQKGKEEFAESLGLLTRMAGDKPLVYSGAAGGYIPDTGKRDASGRLLNEAEKKKADAWRKQGTPSTLGGAPVTWDAKKRDWVAAPATSESADNPFVNNEAADQAVEAATQAAAAASAPAAAPADSVQTQSVDPNVIDPIEGSSRILEILGPEAAKAREYALTELGVLAAARRGDIQRMTEAKTKQAYIDYQKSREVAQINANALVAMAAAGLVKPNIELLNAMNEASAAVSQQIKPYTISYPTPRTTLG